MSGFCHRYSSVSGRTEQRGLYDDAWGEVYRIGKCVLQNGRINGIHVVVLVEARRLATDLVIGLTGERGHVRSTVGIRYKSYVEYG